ncbi:class I SAM-dependent methyltransferase [Microvirga sp. W0021]|uniref:Class I SAM-dependent methyltransferase n=1 Tax=Hohaiivirga grylli TaxID=3133970 RepID=A0ABV0BFH8_9HYPH
MNFIDLIAWDKDETGNEVGAKIPWNDPDFSHRMLENHLAQEHNWASRRKDIISQHTTWISSHLQPASHILDMGCGPGLYTHALAEAGHSCVGVDFSPASIEYAQTKARNDGLNAEYILGDIRDYKSDKIFDCIIMTFGEFNVFTRQDAQGILKNCSDMLRDDGLFILEAHTYEAVEAIGAASATWQRYQSGLFSTNPHLCLQENVWNSENASALSRYFIIDASTSKIQHYASFMQAYTQEEYISLLKEADFFPQHMLVEEWPAGDEFNGKLQVFHCRKGKENP